MEHFHSHITIKSPQRGDAGRDWFWKRKAEQRTFLFHDSGTVTARSDSSLKSRCLLALRGVLKSDSSVIDRKVEYKWTISRIRILSDKLQNPDLRCDSVRLWVGRSDALTPFVCRIVFTHKRTSFISRLSTISNHKLSVMAVTVWYLGEFKRC